MVGGHLVATLGVAVSGTMASLVASVFATGTDYAPFVQVGGASVSTALLGYVLKKVLDGTLVVQPIAKIIADCADREDRLLDLVKDANEREEAWKAHLVGRSAR